MDHRADLSNPVPPVSGSLQKVITTRQFVLMALSSSIGAGVLLATYPSLAVGGSGSLLISFTVVGFAVWATMCALGELSVAFPVSGSFYEYSVRFISPAWGFAMGWNYVINLMLMVVFELVVMLLCVRYWESGMPAYYILPAFIGGLVLVNAFGARWYAEAENFFAVCKMVVLSAFVITAMLIVWKAIPADDRPAEELGIKLWTQDMFKNGVTGFIYAFTAAGTAYGGTEMIGLTATECENPQRVMPLACKLVPVRIVWLYLLPVFMLGCVLRVPLDDDVQSGGISPFVDAMEQANIPVLANIFNGVITVAIFSMASASVFASSRALRAMSARGMGPSLFAKIRWGRPIWALALVFSISLLSFIKMAENGDRVFEWLLALAAGSNYFTWISVCVCHIQLRFAIRRRRGLDEDEILKWKSPLGVVGSIVAILVFLFGLLAQIVAAVESPLPNPPPVLASFVGIIVVLIFWVGYLVFKGGVVFMPLDQIDLKVTVEEAAVRLRASADIEAGKSTESIESTHSHASMRE